MNCTIFISEPWEYSDDKIVGEIVKIFDDKTFLFKANNEYSFKNISSEYFIISTRHVNCFFKNNVSNISINGAILTCNYYEDITKAYILKNCNFCFIGTVTANFSDLIVPKQDNRDFWYEYSKNLISFEKMKEYVSRITEYKSVNEIKNEDLKVFCKTLCNSNGIKDCKGLIYNDCTELSKIFAQNIVLKEYIKKYLNKTVSTLKLPSSKIDFLSLGEGFIYNAKFMQNGDLTIVITEIYNNPDTLNPFFSIIFIKIDKNDL